MHHLQRKACRVTTLAQLACSLCIPQRGEGKNYGFTLAEVLITLGIIGVVAAMTLPALIAKTQKKEATARLKKFYTSMEQAVRLSEIDNGSCSEWEYQIMTDYNDPDQVALNYDISKAFVDKYLVPFVKLKSGEKEWITSTNQKLKGYSIVFADGTIMNAKVGSCVDLSIDINGEKKPNQRGYDQFIFLICKGNTSNKRTCFSSYMPQSTREQNLENCKAQPYYCSALLQWDNWEFKEDYPY